MLPAKAHKAVAQNLLEPSRFTVRYPGASRRRGVFIDSSCSGHSYGARKRRTRDQAAGICAQTFCFSGTCVVAPHRQEATILTRARHIRSQDLFWSQLRGRQAPRPQSCCRRLRTKHPLQRHLRRRASETGGQQPRAGAAYSVAALVLVTGAGKASTAPAIVLPAIVRRTFACTALASQRLGGRRPGASRRRGTLDPSTCPGQNCGAGKHRARIRAASNRAHNICFNGTCVVWPHRQEARCLTMARVFRSQHCSGYRCDAGKRCARSRAAGDCAQNICFTRTCIAAPHAQKFMILTQARRTRSEHLFWSEMQGRQAPRPQSCCQQSRAEHLLALHLSRRASEAGGPTASRRRGILGQSTCSGQDCGAGKRRTRNRAASNCAQDIRLHCTCVPAPQRQEASSLAQARHTRSEHLFWSGLRGRQAPHPQSCCQQLCAKHLLLRHLRRRTSEAGGPRASRRRGILGQSTCSGQNCGAGKRRTRNRAASNCAQNICLHCTCVPAPQRQEVQEPRAGAAYSVKALVSVRSAGQASAAPAIVLPAIARRTFASTALASSRLRGRRPAASRRRGILGQSTCSGQNCGAGKRRTRNRAASNCAQNICLHCTCVPAPQR